MTGTALLGIVAAAVAGWLVGSAWYGLLGRTRARALGSEREAVERSAGRPPVGALVLAFVAELAMATMLSGIVVHVGETNVRRAMVSAAFVWFGFVLTTVATNNAFARRAPLLTVIDAGHWMAVLLVMGAAIGVVGR